MTILGTDHTSFVVTDLERSLEFWNGKLGLEIVWRLDDDAGELRTIVGFADARIRMAHLAIPGSDHRIELFEYVAPQEAGSAPHRNRIGAAHVGFLVDDIRAEVARLRAAGVDSFVSEPTMFRDGPDAGLWGVYLEDPDGITIELSQPETSP